MSDVEGSVICTHTHRVRNSGPGPTGRSTEAVNYLHGHTQRQRSDSTLSAAYEKGDAYLDLLRYVRQEDAEREQTAKNHRHDSLFLRTWVHSGTNTCVSNTRSATVASVPKSSTSRLMQQQTKYTASMWTDCRRQQLVHNSSRYGATLAQQIALCAEYKRVMCRKP